MKRGLFLQGGGALGAWQAGALEALDAAGVRFDRVVGYSIGAVNGAAYALGRLAEGLERWRRLDGDALRLALSPRTRSFLDPSALREFFLEAADDEAAKSALRVPLTVISACPELGAPVNAEFSPGGRGAWDGPLLAHLEATCGIPWVLPSRRVAWRGKERTLIDGGITMPAPFDLTALADCGEVLVLEMTRADELGARWWRPWRALDQRSRDAQRRLVDRGLASSLPHEPPRVVRLEPSRRLEPVILDFRREGLRRMLEQGAEDARRLLRSLEPRGAA